MSGDQLSFGLEEPVAPAPDQGPRPPAGDDGPDRHRIQHQHDANQFVEAGAGTGKTTQLVGRIVELLCSGAETIDHLAVITFTEAAAAELRDRIYAELERAAGVAPGGGATHAAGTAAAGTDPEFRTRLAQAALDEIDTATVTTLHGFAQRILATHPFEAGLPPVFEVLDDARSTLAFDERWDDHVDRILDDPALEPVLWRYLACGGSIPALQTVAEQFDQSWDRLLDLTLDPPPLAPVDPLPVVELLERLAAKADACTADDDLLLEHVRGLDPLRRALAGATSDVEVIQLLGSVPTLTCGKGQKANWGCPVDEVRDLTADAEAARAGLLADVASSAVANLVPTLRGVVLDGAEARRREGRLQFHDLLVRALLLVRTDPEVRRTLHDRYRRLFIDEFQDTDPIQAELAVRIAHGGDQPPDAEWTDLPVEPGRLFMVGDPKQAIYRFRRADIGLFLEMQRRFADDLLTLSGNFRSVPGILDWVNAVFAREMKEEAGVQPAYGPLQARRAGPADPGIEGPPVILLGEAMAVRTIAEVRAREAADIAATVQRIRAEGWRVGDAGEPARLKDITILVPARTGLPALEQALDAGDIPYRLGSSSLVYDSAEVGELLAVLRAVDDPTDQISLVAALRSAPFGCGDDDLLAHYRAGGRWDYRARLPEGVRPDGPVAQGMALLHELHRQRWWRDVSGLIDEVVARCRLFELSVDDRRHRDAWRRLRFVVDQARWFADTHGGDLRRYLAWVDLQQRDDVQAMEVVLPESDDDAVEILTVHGAKGLEFPIVVLAGLNRTPPNETGPRVLWGAAGPEVRVKKPLITRGYAELLQREQAIERAQDLRLLYVAATRARDHLVVCLHHKANTDCHAKVLAPVETERPELTRRPAPQVEEPAPAPRAPVGEPPVVDTPEDRRAWVEEHRLLVGPGATPRTLSATAIADLGRRAAELAPAAVVAGAAELAPADIDGGEPAAAASGYDAVAGDGEAASDGAVDPDDLAGDDDEVDPEAPPWRRGRAGTAIGRAVHAVLQLVDLATGEGVDELAAAQAVAEGVPGRQEEIAALARAALASDLIREAVAGGRYFRELYVGAPLGDEADGPVVEGFVDLLIETPEGYTVVDYKTDSVSESRVAAAAARYRLQGATYALAVERALGRPVTRCAFLFVRTPGEATVSEVDDLRGAMGEVVELVDRQPGPSRMTVG